jgi:hypothetical protein
MNHVRLLESCYMRWRPPVTPGGRPHLRDGPPPAERSSAGFRPNQSPMCHCSAFNAPVRAADGQLQTRPSMKSSVPSEWHSATLGGIRARGYSDP